MTFLNLSPDDDLQYILDNLDGPTTIYLAEGVYRQKIELRADDVTLIGAKRETTVISYGDYARKMHSDGREYNTFRTYTLCVTGERVKLVNLTVENTNVDPERVGQCVALSVNSKFFTAQNADFKSTQDTLFLSPFPDDLVVRYRGFIPENQLYSEGTSLHLFENCRIFGTVDFIFGCAEAYFKNCEIISLRDSRNCGFVAAPAHSLKQERGFVFCDCDFSPRGAQEGTVFLARPWRDFGKCEFVKCRLGRHIRPELFDKWNDTERDKTARFSYGKLETSFDIRPTDWAKALSEGEVCKIIARCEEKFKDNKI